jgi:hypothetical protein
MSEKISCKACYKKYSPARTRVCPGCGLSPQDAEYFQGSSGKSGDLAEVLPTTFQQYTGLESQDLRDDVNRLSSAIGALATGLFSMILLTVVGGLLIGGGTASAVSCALTGDSCGSATIVWGQICLGVGVVAGIVSAITAMVRASLN